MIKDCDKSLWSGDGPLTERLIDVIGALPHVAFLKVEDAPASRSDPAFSFISNELFVGFSSTRRVVRRLRFGWLPWWTSCSVPDLTLAELEAHVAAADGVGPADYSDEGMLQFLRSERVIPAYQTRGYKLVELVRVYELGTAPRRGR